MTVTVRLFASYAEALGKSHLELTIPEGSTVADVMRSVNGMPGGNGLPPSPLVAVNYSYASSTKPLANGDEIAIIPPVAGG
jgi:molybdopterin converting factor subunit 1